MTRARLLTLSLGLFSILPLSAQEKLNFVFFLADDLGYHDVGFNNPETFYETPHLDSLAKSGMVFTDFYAASQVCSPTRASIFTGKYPARTDTTNYFSGRRNGTYAAATFQSRMALEEVTLAEMLRDNGYQTFFAGKWHLGGEGHLPTDQGFQINKGGGSNGLPRSYFSPYKNVQNLSPGPEGEFLTDRLAMESVAFLEQAAGSPDPFLLYLSFYSVHTPLQAPKRLVDKYTKKAKDLGIDDVAGSFDPEGERQVWPGAKGGRKLRVRQNHATYAAMVESLDRAVGRVLQRLDELGMRDNTAIVFMSDNGGLSTSEGWPTSNLPLRGGKGWMYEGGIREPVIFRWPGVTPAGTRCNVPAVSTDFYPTLLAMAGLEPLPDQHVDGVNLEPLLRNPFAKFDRGPIFFHYPHYANQGGFPASAIRKGEYKLIQDLEDGAFELYHLETDEEEHNNLEQLEADRVKELADALNEWRVEVDAKPLRPNPDTGAKPPKLW
ncbi:MAG: sulfatase [Verrucomicrobiales bacterium]|jgi:arylsulfatase A-like enzyme|nr:sulfatase [Verrucomicrobiales bacterium]